MTSVQFLFAILVASMAIADDVQEKDNEVLTEDISGNRTVRLVGARTSGTPGQNLGAKFVEIEPTPGKEVYVGFPSHSHTIHETTLIRIIECSIAWGQRQQELHVPQFEVVFSIPQFPKGYVSDYKFERWYLISIKPSEPKTDQRKAADKVRYPGAGTRQIITGPQNRAVKLVGVRYSESRRRDLIAKFEEVAPHHGGEIELGLGASMRPTGDQTIVDVTHMRTILNIIKSSVSGAALPDPRLNVTQWREPLFEVIFLIPQDAHGYVTDFTRWSLVSIKLPKAKKQQPKSPDK